MNDRQKEILSLTQKRGEITIKELAMHMAVSEMTIHRDLDYLQGQKYLYKKRGAAVFVELPDRVRDGFYEKEKRAIACQVARMLKPKQYVLFDNSTTVLECAKQLDPSLALTCYTTGIESTSVLSQKSGFVLHCSGGYFFPESRGFIGDQTEKFVSTVYADVCLIGASGISVEGGVTTPYPPHSFLQKGIIKVSGECWLVADHSKFGKRALDKIVGLSEVTQIITDSGISDRDYQQFSQYVKIVVAGDEKE